MLTAAFMLGVLGAACVVLRNPNQARRDGRRLPAGFGWLGLVLIAASFWAALQAMRPLAAVFSVATLLMLAFTVLPAVQPIWRSRRRTAARDGHHG